MDVSSVCNFEIEGFRPSEKGRVEHTHPNTYLQEKEITLNLI